jgi:N-acetylmuramoyl-L-alanine amidase
MQVLYKVKKAVLLINLIFSVAAFSQAKDFKVALDAGHGGKDFGAVYSGHIEKNISLAVALKVGGILEKTPGISVIYTRKSDVFIELIERANIANKADSHIFVSIHCNANKNSAAAGTETYVMGMTKNASNLEAARRENAVITLENDYKEKYEGYDPNNPESRIGIDLSQELYLENSIALASKIQDIFTDALGKKSRGVKQAPYMVLHKAYMPRVLVEMGFISNPVDGAYLDSEQGQNETARAIADAIISYRKEYFGDGSGGESLPKPSTQVKETTETKVVNDTVDKTTELKENKVEEKPTDKKKVEKEKEKEKANVGLVFKVQISSSPDKLEPKPANFNGLGQISVLTVNDTYKYLYGSTDNYEDARRLLADAKAKGYASAFVVAFKDGKQISVQEALGKK